MYRKYYRMHENLSLRNQLWYVVSRCRTLDMSINKGHVALHVEFLMLFYCYITIAQLLDGHSDCYDIIFKTANMCDVGPWVKVHWRNDDSNTVSGEDIWDKARHGITIAL